MILLLKYAYQVILSVFFCCGLPLHKLFLSLSFRRLISEVAERNSTKIGNMVRSNSNFKTHDRNLGYPSSYKTGAQKPPFWTTSQLNGNFNGLYLRNETQYRQLVKCVDNYNGSPTSSQNVINFGLQTASNSTCIFTHPPQILHSASLPGFADGDQPTELRKTLPHNG